MKSNYASYYYIPCFVFASLLLNGCFIEDNDRVEGRGPSIVEVFELNDFNRISMSIPGDIIITQAESESVSISTQANILEQLDVFVSNGRLHLEVEDNVSVEPTRPIVIEVAVVGLDALSFAGAGSATLDALDVPSLDVSVAGSADINLIDLVTRSLEVDISGSSNVWISGSAEEQDINVSGEADIDARSFLTTEAHVRITGSGTAIINASDLLVSRITGAGTIRYIGSPTLDTSIQGAGTVTSFGG